MTFAVVLTLEVGLPLPSFTDRVSVGEEEATLTSFGEPALSTAVPLTLAAAVILATPPLVLLAVVRVTDATPAVSVTAEVVENAKSVLEEANVTATLD